MYSILLCYDTHVAIVLINSSNSVHSNGYYIIEINAAPGLDHYVTTGEEQKKIVETMYLKVLKALGKK